ncbi:uncharacterized protein VTP21DRAFT_1374 [Calcarisporiella thermophila]|uniref:uncharacterized protein n=1 Tax=Calcarisporiella thermophila TaxID=911321 RepID=UPI0037435C3B
MSDKQKTDSADANSSIIERVNELLDEGTRSFALQEYEISVQRFGEASEILGREYGERSPMCADAYLLYGRALLHSAIQQNSVLGGNVIKDKDESLPQASCPSKARINFEADPDPDTDEKNENSENEEEKEDDSGDDLTYAWEILDLARLIYSDMTTRDAKLKLGDVLLALGDVSLESENFDQAVVDYKEALQIKAGLLSPNDRQLAEAHYKLALAYEFSSSEQHLAAEHIVKATQVLHQRLEFLRQQRDLKTSNSSESEKGKERNVTTEIPVDIEEEIEEIEGLLPDMEQKLEDINSLQASGKSDIETMIRNTISGNSANASKATVTTAVHDLTSLIRSTKNGPQKDVASQNNGIASEGDRKRKQESEDAVESNQIPSESTTKRPKA